MPCASAAGAPALAAGSHAIPLVVGVGVACAVSLAGVAALLLRPHPGPPPPAAAAPSAAATSAVDTNAPALAAGPTLPPSEPHRVFHIGGTGGLRRFAELPPLIPGDEIAVAAGTYHDSALWRFSLDARHPVWVHGPPDGGAIIDGAGLPLDGVWPNHRALFQIEGGCMRISNLVFRNAHNGHNAGGLWLSQGAQGDIEACTLTANDIGLQVTNGDGVDLTDCRISGNGIDPNIAAPNITAYECGHLRLTHCDLTDSIGENLWSTATSTTLIGCRIARSQNAEIVIAAPEHPTPVGASWIIDSVITTAAARRGNQSFVLECLAPGASLGLINDTILLGAAEQVLVTSAAETRITALDCIVSGSNRYAQGPGAWSGAGNALAYGPPPDGLTPGSPDLARRVLELVGSTAPECLQLPGGIAPARWTWSAGAEPDLSLLRGLSEQAWPIGAGAWPVGPGP